MSEIKIGEKTIGVRATPLALLFYRKEFKTDLLSALIKLSAGMMGLITAITGKELNELQDEDLTAMDTSNIDMSVLAAFDIDVIGIMQIVWAMAKADKFNERFPGFEQWFLSLGEFDLLNDLFSLLAALEVAADGFLHRGKKQK